MEKKKGHRKKKINNQPTTKTWPNVLPRENPKYMLNQQNYKNNNMLTEENHSPPWDV
jgi:hypothetical protein